LKEKQNKKALILIDYANMRNWYNKISKEVDMKLLFEFLNEEFNCIDIKVYFWTDKKYGKSKRLETFFIKNWYTFITKPIKYISTNVFYTNFRKEVEDALKEINLLDNWFIEMRQILNSFWEKNRDFEKLVSSITGKLNEEIQSIRNTINKVIYDLNKLKKKPKCNFDVEIVNDSYKNFNNFDSLVVFSEDWDFASLYSSMIKSQKEVIVFWSERIAKELIEWKFKIKKLPKRVLRDTKKTP